MRWVVLVSLALTVVGEQVHDDDWIDPYDMINYDSSTKTMKKPVESANYPNVPTKRREHTPDSGQPADAHCVRKLMELQKQIDEQNKRIKALSQQATCTPVFKRFLRRLLKEVERVGVPTDSTDGLYDGKIKLSRQSMAEIQTLLEGEESWRTGALDNAVSQILVDLKPHDYEAWKWRFEDAFGIELDTVLKLGLGVLLMVAIVSTPLLSRVPWCTLLGRLFVLCFFVSIIWNWFYLYKIAFAEHQKNMAKLEGISGKCTGLKNYNWYDNLKELYRSTWTLQDDPCKKYYEVIYVNPLLLVPPTKAMSVTIVTVITEPLKHLGEGISDFIRALFKDLPVTWQIVVFPTIVLLILAFMYLSVNGAFRYGIMAPFHRPQPDPPPPQLRQPQYHLQEIQDNEQLTRHISPRGGHLAASASRNQIQQRRTRPQEKAAKMVVRTLRSGDDTNAQRRDAELSLSAESDSEELLQSPEALTGASANANQTRTQDDATDSNAPQSQTKQATVNKKASKDKAGKVSRANKPPAGEQPSQAHIQRYNGRVTSYKLELRTGEGDKLPPGSLTPGVETVRVPVQETLSIVNSGSSLEPSVT
ncbi:chloride channel CLIC-like protein 1 isoform X1 [Takifugu rubripes]|uniref:Chloride channel CLIC-like protein 1 n=1 Tax=Takifugu rubripes TaxID=31033 RepID=A0A6D2VWF0_TAKRU|nr:chloride channel CLIC-like protein 1 isoform X1 [Takifugu rubripes]XP_011613237.2 chloride channel CLIC-like protein 1 isoform X1 [Takifugu rubripes]